MSSIHDEWLGLVRPTGVVVEPRVLDDLGLAPEKLAAADGLALEGLLADGKLQDADALFADVLGWNAALVRGLDDQSIPPELTIRLPEHDTTLAPTYAIPEIGDSAEGKWQLLIRVEEPGVTPDGVNQLTGWGASPHHRLERLLRDTGIPAGLLVTDDRVRLVTAPKGETSGWLDFLFQPMTEVAGRPILAAMKLLLGPARFFWGDTVAKLPALLRSSRQAQDNVSTELSKQVLAALHELLRGLYAADPELIAELARERPQHLYEGLLAVLMRLVFVLYAEDRDLMPSRRDGDWLPLYENSYSLRRLRERLEEDFALYADTMDDRRGAWGQLVALFRLVANGDQWGWMQARRGKLFDPNSFPFLEGRTNDDEDASVLAVSDGCVRRILDQLVILNGRRLSYRSLDVEQIGSVYETIMGFTVELASGPSLAIKGGKNNRTPVFVDLVAAVSIAGKDRLKWLKQATGRDKFGNADARIKSASDTESLASALAPVADERASPGGRTVAQGTPILQPTDERRRTGSHYTPRSLTEPIVRRALEPTFVRLGMQVAPQQVLEIKVCDLAMGSGAFLVEACRQIAERLVEAWNRFPAERPGIPAHEDEIIHARRLVAQRCIYGVDRNPMAVDLARLSLWLATLARDHEFSFLDHALKCGDSIVGLRRDQLEGATWQEKATPGLWKARIREDVERALSQRASIRGAPDDVSLATQAARFEEVERSLEQVRLIGNAVIASFFMAESAAARRRLVAEVGDRAGSAQWDWMRQRALGLEGSRYPVHPFHWDIEFPEVFGRENPGFDAVVGNPPFLGGTRISTECSKTYVEYLWECYEGGGGRTDLVAYFFRRAFALLRKTGCFGLIASNTISQGETRAAGLGVLTKMGSIVCATRRLSWPGEAAVVVSVVHVGKDVHLNPILDGKPVERITSYLFSDGPDDEPRRLASNRRRAFEGMVPYGDGFMIVGKELKDRPSAAEWIFPYARGKHVASSPVALPNDWIVYLRDKNITEVEDSVLASRLEEEVKPDRATRSREVASANWWTFWRPRMRLWAKMQSVKYVLVRVRVAAHHAFERYPMPVVPDTSLVVVPDESFGTFAILQSRLHEIWARFFSSSMKDDPRYTPSDCFETFPFPPGFGSNPDLERAGRGYYEHRARLMLSRGIGMTKTYNLFHDPEQQGSDIRELRELQSELDRAILRAYGWDDLIETEKPVFLTAETEGEYRYQRRFFWAAPMRDEVLTRLLKLNQLRAAEEAREPLDAVFDDDEEEVDDLDELSAEAAE